jgi:hypothetical protein
MIIISLPHENPLLVARIFYIHKSYDFRSKYFIGFSGEQLIIKFNYD